MNDARSFRFSKRERVTSKKDIKELFNNGSFFHLRPLQFKVLQRKELTHNQVLVAVPKKHHKKAVDRNTIKRRLREAYRINKHLKEAGPCYLIAIIYLSPDILPYDEIQQKLIKGLQRLSQDQLKEQQG